MREITGLIKLGMTEYEAKAYLSLIKLGPSKVKEIVADSKLPRNKAYEALEKLEENGKIVSLPIKPKKYRINEISSLDNDLHELISVIEDLKKIAKSRKEIKNKEFFWIIKGKKAIEEKLSDNTKNVKHEILTCNNLSKVLFKNIRTMEEAKKRGVKIKIICDYINSKNGVYRNWISTGAEIRIFNKGLFGQNLPRISIFDSKAARLTVGRPEVLDDKDYITLWTESRVFAQMLRGYFLNMWEHSLPITKFLRK